MKHKITKNTYNSNINSIENELLTWSSCEKEGSWYKVELVAATDKSVSGGRLES